MEQTTEPDLTEEIIAEAMARAETVACAPGDQRSYPMPDTVEDARKSCTPTGRWRLGWIVADDGRKRRDVWIDVLTGEGRLGKQAGTTRGQASRPCETRN